MVIRHFALGAFVALSLFACAQEPGYTDNKDTVASTAPQAAIIDKVGENAYPMLESRGVWMIWQDFSSADKEVTLKKLDEFKDIGLNTVYLATNMRGYVVYPDSEFLPQFPDIQTSQPDVLQWLIPAVKERGLRCEAWPEYGFYTYWVPKDSDDKTMGAVLEKHPELAAIDKDGGKAHVDAMLGSFYALCAANPKTHEYVVGSYMEVLRKYPFFDGLNLDRIRWTNDKFCYCDYCKTSFKEKTGFELVPGFKDGSDEAKARDEFRREGTREFVRKMHEAMKVEFPGKSLTSAVVAPSLIEEKGQDWPTWIENGYIDAVMPMIYGANITPELDFIRKRLGNDAPIFAGLGNANGAEKFARLVMELRALAIPGYTIWSSNDLDLVSNGMAKKINWRPAVTPFRARPPK